MYYYLFNVLELIGLDATDVEKVAEGIAMEKCFGDEKNERDEGLGLYV